MVLVGRVVEITQVFCRNDLGKGERGRDTGGESVCKNGEGRGEGV